MTPLAKDTTPTAHAYVLSLSNLSRARELTHPPTPQYSDIVGPGSPQFDDAYFEVSYLRAYTTALPTSTSVSVPPTQVGAAPTTVSNPASSITPAPTQLTGSGKSGAGSVRLAGGAQAVAAVAAGLVWFVMNA